MGVLKGAMITEENYLRLKSESYGISISSNLRIYMGGEEVISKREQIFCMRIKDIISNLIS